ncbi:DUF1254 domain-containing protein [Agarivorans aestuarii]|uniref:DUF1254 domain-containing protein n=1 Tax=Agarivorans aestuarii TaxID=1563703 RepID=A0ABU7G449_9ALTE|nr:DUF1254 domain-containing protein [Agarivorans aestuarii]MEE1674182.1 DUF1254 domain-containing protein [Agarivorans aestuarii]
MLKKNKLALALTMTLSLGAASLAATPAIAGANTQVFSTEVTQDQAVQLASEAYVYAYPIVLMDLTLEQQANKGVAVNGGFKHFRSYPDADFKEVVRPNFDTLYSIGWFDVSEEPVIISSEDTDGHYHLLPMYDMWTDIYASPGSRTSGTEGGAFAIVSEGWEGELPEGVDKIVSPTTMNWMIARIESNGRDYDKVGEIQDGLKMTPLSKWGTDYVAPKAPIDKSIDMVTPPLQTLAEMSTKEFFERAGNLIAKYGTHATDNSQLMRLERIGLNVEAGWDVDSLSKSEVAALEAGIAKGKVDIKSYIPKIETPRNGWVIPSDTMGVYGNHYIKRAAIALIGLGANHPEDAIYPLAIADGDGDKMVATQDYTLHFEADDLPPVGAFWSVTMYDAEGFAVHNELDRYAIGDRNELTYNEDGSLTLYMQHERPSEDKVSNWLPSPAKGDIGVTMRLYEPKQSILTGEWIPPAIEKK